MTTNTARDCRVLIIDDELPARKRLKLLLDSLAGYHWVGEAANADEGLQQTAALHADIVLLDISMPDTSGLQLAAKLAELAHPPAVIFCTAHDQHALAAFSAQAGAYLLKPVKSEQLLTALQHVRRLNRAQHGIVKDDEIDGGASNKSDEKTTLDQIASAYLFSKSARGEERIKVAEVAALVASDKYVSAYLNSREIILDYSLKALERAYSAAFIRVHRNALVSRLHITAIVRSEQSGRMRVTLRDCDVAPLISRRHLPDLRRALREQQSPALNKSIGRSIGKSIGKSINKPINKQ